MLPAGFHVAIIDGESHIAQPDATLTLCCLRAHFVTEKAADPTCPRCLAIVAHPVAARLSDGQREGLRALLERGAVPGASYIMPLWAFQQHGYFSVEGRSMGGLVRRGLAERHAGHLETPCWKLSEAGLELATLIVDSDA